VAPRSHPYGQVATFVGQVIARDPGTVVMETPYGLERILDMVHAEGIAAQDLLTGAYPRLFLVTKRDPHLGYRHPI
jgi:hypothetical protein